MSKKIVGGIFGKKKKAAAAPAPTPEAAAAKAKWAPVVSQLGAAASTAAPRSGGKMLDGLLAKWRSQGGSTILSNKLGG